MRTIRLERDIFRIVVRFRKIRRDPDGDGRERSP